MLGLRLALLALFATPFSLAYVRTMASTGFPLFWSTPTVSVSVNPLNSSGLSAAQVNSLLAPAFSSWQVSGTRAGFTYSQSTTYPTGGADGVNSVAFTSQSGDYLGYGVVAVTQVVYYVSSGQIAEADMLFNDSQFLFTANAGDTGTNIGGRTAIYLRDVATHEAGHMLGFDHSLVNWSTLIFTAFNGQYVLSEDDLTGVRTVYADGSRNGGSLSGKVSGTNGGIFGAHVSAINLDTGHIEAAGLSGPDGSFRLGDLPVGNYAVMMEPMGTDASSVSPYYQNVNQRFCGGGKFRRRFYADCQGTGGASVLAVNGNSDTNLGTLSPSCAAMGNPGTAPTSLATAKLLPSDGGAAFGTLTPGTAHYYRVPNVAGQLRARALSYSLFSPIDPLVEILDSSGQAVAGATSVDNVEAPGAGGNVNYDSSASANVPSGDYVIRVTAAPSYVGYNKFSAGSYLVDNSGYYLLSLEVNGAIAATGTTDMSACVSVPNTPQSATYSPSPKQTATTQNAGCGQISGPGGGGPFWGGMTSVLATAAALHAWILARRHRLLAALVRRRR